MSRPSRFRMSLAVVLSAWGALSVAFATPPRTPNIVIIYTDDQGYGDASCLNPAAKFRTPNLDRLASEGVAFTNAHCADSVCTPSRYGLLTGRYCWRTRLKRGVLGAEAPCLIADGRWTIGTLLRDAGYRTAIVGKWHLGMTFPGPPEARDWSRPVLDMPLDKGFDYFYGVPASLNFGVLAWFEGRRAATPPTRYTNKKPNPRHVDYRITPPYQATPEATQQALGTRGFEVARDFRDEDCLTRFVDRALAWIRSGLEADADQPFLLYLPLTSPHYPVCPLPRYHGKGAAGAYGEFMIETDDHVGEVLRFLDEQDLADNTVVVFTSDNGPERSWRRRFQEFGHRSNGEFRGGKRDVYEGGHRVPFLVRWPSGIASPGRTCDALVGQVDLVATLAELIGRALPADAGEDSQSFLGVLKDPSATHQRAPLVVHGGSGRFGVHDGRWKLLMPHRRASRELYDLQTDIRESNNVVEAHSQRAKELESALTRIVVRGRTTPGAAQPNDTGHWEDLTWMKLADPSSKIGPQDQAESESK